MKFAFILVAVFLTLGCKTPERLVEHKEYANGQLVKVDRSKETGYQLFWGERHDQMADAKSEIGKRTMGVAGMSLGGALIGAAFKNPAAGALVGSIVGATEKMTDSKDSVTSSTKTQ